MSTATPPMSTATPPTSALGGLSLGEEPAAGPPINPEVEALRQQLHEKERQADKLAGTLAHYRRWAGQLQARYIAYNPEAARPARRIYIGGLPPEGSTMLLDSTRSSLESAGTTDGPVAMQLSALPSPQSSGDGAALPSLLQNAQITAAVRSHHQGLGPDSRKGSGDSGGGRVTRTAAYATQLEADLRQFVNRVLLKAGACVSPGYPVTSCKVYPDRWFAFCEFRSVEEASNCTALDGITYQGHVLRIRRPNNYDPDAAIMLGPTEPDPSVDISEHPLVRTVVPDTPDKLFLGGLPCDWTEDQVKGMLLPFGALRAFNLVQDKTTGNSKGYAFCEYLDTRNTDAAIQALNAKQIGKRFLTAKRAVAPPQQQHSPQQQQQLLRNM